MCSPPHCKVRVIIWVAVMCKPTLCPCPLARRYKIASSHVLGWRLSCLLQGYSRYEGNPYCYIFLHTLPREAGMRVSDWLCPVFSRSHWLNPVGRHPRLLVCLCMFAFYGWLLRARASPPLISVSSVHLPHHWVCSPWIPSLHAACLPSWSRNKRLITRSSFAFARIY